MVWRTDREEEFVILTVLIADPPLLNVRSEILVCHGAESYYSARAMAVPFPYMAVFTFPFSVVTLERG